MPEVAPLFSAQNIPNIPEPQDIKTSMHPEILTKISIIVEMYENLIENSLR